MVMYSFEGWNAHQSLGMLISKRMENAGLKPTGFVANDYALACYGLEPVTDPRPLLSADILEDEFTQWVESSNLLKRAFREVAVIGGLVERQHPGKRKTGRQVSFSTDLIYDVLRRYEPDHLLMRAAWTDARARMTELGRLARLVDRAAATMVHVDCDRITPDGGAADGHRRPRGPSAGLGGRGSALRSGSACRGSDGCWLAVDSQSESGEAGNMYRLAITLALAFFLGGCVVATGRRDRCRRRDHCRSRWLRRASMPRPPASRKPTKSAAESCARPTRNVPAKLRQLEERCRLGQPLPEDVCPAAEPR